MAVERIKKGDINCVVAMMRGALLKNQQKQLFIIVDSASRWHGAPPPQKNSPEISK